MIQYIKRALNVYKYNLKELLMFTALGCIFTLMANALFFPIPTIERLINGVINISSPITFLEIRNLFGCYITRIFLLHVFWTLPIIFLSLSALNSQKVNFSMIKEVIRSHFKAFIAIYALQEIVGIVVSVIWYVIDCISKYGNSIESDGLVMIGIALYVIAVIAIIWMIPIYHMVVFYAPIIAINEKLELIPAIRKGIDLLKKSGFRIVLRSIFVTFLIFLFVSALMFPVKFIFNDIYTNALQVAYCFVFPVETAVYFQMLEEVKYQKFYQLNSSYSKFIYTIFGM